MVILLLYEYWTNVNYALLVIACACCHAWDAARHSDPIMQPPVYPIAYTP